VVLPEAEILKKSVIMLCYKNCISFVQ